MELKLCVSKSLSGPFFNSSHRASQKVSQHLCSSKGKFTKAAYLSTSGNTMSAVSNDKLMVDTYSFRMNGTNGASPNIYFSKRVLDYLDDEYGGVVINPENLPSNPSVFASVLRSSLSRWMLQGKKGVWLKLPLEKSELVPIAVKEGFQYHHAERQYLMLTYWIPEGPSMLPDNASHQVGVGSFVVNESNEVLVVQEKHTAPALTGLWKLPTGFIQESEEIFTGAVREVKEETGIDTEFVEVVAFRHAQNVAFQKSDLFFVCMLRPLSNQIVIDDIEVQAAKWMPLDEFTEQPLIQGDNMFKKIIDICIARLGKKYCGLNVHPVVSKFDGKLSSLYYRLVGITVQGNGLIDGRGAIWWQDYSSNDPLDGESKLIVPLSDSVAHLQTPVNSSLVGKMPNIKPTALRFYGSLNVTVTGITIRNSPQCHLKLDNCVGVSVYSMNVLSPADSPNTDGIHLQNSREVLIHNTNLACGDDCISIQTGCSNVYIHNVNCGLGHGISIGGLGKDNTKACVSNITVRDINMHNTMNGVRIKTWQAYVDVILDLASHFITRLRCYASFCRTLASHAVTTSYC